MDDWDSKVTGGAACPIPVEVLLSDTVFKTIEVEGADEIFLLSESKEMSQGEESAQGLVEVRVIAVKFKEGFSPQVMKDGVREVVLGDPAAVFFKEEGGVEVVELDLTKFVCH